MNEMKQMFKVFVAIAAIAVGITACSNEEIIPDVQLPALERASLTIILNNNEPATKAGGDANAVDAEVAISSISLFIFGQQGTQAEADTLFKENAGTNSFAPVQGVANQYSATFFNAPVGNKNAYVGVNLPQALHDYIKENGVAAIYELNDLTKLAVLSPASGGFPMFSDDSKPSSLKIESTGNTLEVNVKRFVAKVTLETAKDFEDNKDGARTANGVTVDSDLTFAMGQMNTKFFSFPQKEAGKYKDPNYSAVLNGNAFNYQADFINEWSHDFRTDLNWPNDAFAKFKAVAKSTANDIEDLSPGYVLENTNEKKLKGELTYAAVKAKFTPEYTHSYTSSGGVVAKKNTVNKNDFDTLFVFNRGGNYYYFEELADANAYKTDNGMNYLMYVDCTCFYNVYLNPDAAYNVYRNDYYQVTVNKIARLGNPYPGTDDPTLELGGMADLAVTINVQSWNKVSQNTILGGKE
jgi:hypothetical protein